ncbi:MAG TPA: hypothetical protein VKB96_01415 [Gammaproteobacteria bacterium]|nr:hypothetical protein [Gammaproteobacteria bacterium]
MLSATTHKTWSCGIGKCATWEIFLKRLLAPVWSKVVRRTLYVWRGQLVKGGNGPHAFTLKPRGSSMYVNATSRLLSVLSAFDRYDRFHT